LGKKGGKTSSSPSPQRGDRVAAEKESAEDFHRGRKEEEKGEGRLRTVLLTRRRDAKGAMKEEDV